MTLQSYTFVMPFSPSYRDCLIPAELSPNIVSKMTDTAGEDFFQGTTSLPPIVKFSLNLPSALKLLHPQSLGVFQCQA